MEEHRTMAKSLGEIFEVRPRGWHNINELCVCLVGLGYERWQDLDSSEAGAEAQDKGLGCDLVWIAKEAVSIAAARGDLGRAQRPAKKNRGEVSTGVIVATASATRVAEAFDRRDTGRQHMGSFAH